MKDCDKGDVDDGGDGGYVCGGEFTGEGGDEGNDICDCRLAFATVKSGNF